MNRPLWGGGGGGAPGTPAWRLGKGARAWQEHQGPCVPGTGLGALGLWGRTFPALEEFRGD